MGELPYGYASEKEFFITSFHNMAEYLADLQKETLQELCAGFIRKLESGKVTLEVIDEFRSSLDRLISPADFKMVSAAMAGSSAFIKQRLLTLEPVSIVGEERKSSGRDREAERNIRETYTRLKFDRLAKGVEDAPHDHSANAALACARKEVADYCCLYRIPMDETNTLTPFSLSTVDAALAACYRLYKDINRATGRAL